MKKKHRRAVLYGIEAILAPFIVIAIILELPCKGLDKLYDWLKTKLRVYDNDPD